MLSQSLIRQIALTILITIPSTYAQLKPLSYVGCFKTSNGLTKVNTYQYQTDGYCQGLCVKDNDNAPVLGLTSGTDCYCGSQTPNASDKVDDSNCSQGCAGFGDHKCGAANFWSVYLTGTEDTVSSVGGGSISSSGTTSGPSTTTTNSSPSVITSIAPGRTVVITQSANATPDSQAASADNNGGGGKSNAGTIAGAVIGVILGLALLAGIAFFLWRRKRKQERDAEREKSASTFLAGGRPTIPATNNSATAVGAGLRRPSGPDSRLQDSNARRLSNGSIDDLPEQNQPKVLKVVNAGPDDNRPVTQYMPDNRSPHPLDNRIPSYYSADNRPSTNNYSPSPSRGGYRRA